MAKGRPIGLRLETAERGQKKWDESSLDDLLGADHVARQVWDYVEGLDLGVLYGRVRTTVQSSGRPAIDPAILMALWLYGTLDGVGSARLLDRLCGSEAAYRWLCGGVGVNYHTLSDFRVEAGPLLDDLLSKSVAGLIEAGLVDISTVAVDGIRVRASAGASSFRRGQRLGECTRRRRKRLGSCGRRSRRIPGRPSVVVGRGVRRRRRIGCAVWRRPGRHTPRSSSGGSRKPPINGVRRSRTRGRCGRRPATRRRGS